MKILTVILLVLLLAPLAFSQAARYDNFTWTTSAGAIVPIAGASITICSFPATGQTASTPCTNKASICTSSTMVSCSTSGNPVTSDAQGNFGFWAASGTYDYSVCTGGVCYGPYHAFLGVMPGVATAVNNLNGIHFADGFTGADCGAKINAADADLGATEGEIWVNQNCGTTWSTAVTITNKHILRFIQGGTYTISAMITLSGADTGIAGMPSSHDEPAVIIKMANSANLTAIVNVTGAGAVIQDIQLDGNRTNNISNGTGIYVNNVPRVEISRVVVMECFLDGVSFLSTGTSNAASSPKIFKLMTKQNGRDGLRALGTADGFISNSEFEFNAANGITLSDSPTWRIEHSDSSNFLRGIDIYGTDAGLGSNAELIIGNQLANGQDDIRIAGWGTSGPVSRGNIISGNNFWPAPTAFSRTDATYDGVRIIDSGGNSIGPNTFKILAAHRLNHLVNITETVGGREDKDSVFGNMRDATSAEVAAGYIGYIPSGVSTTLSGNEDGSFVGALGGITNGIGLQLFSSTTTCTTAASVGATCTTAAITLPVAYADTGYRLSCTGQTATNVPVVQTYAKSNTTFTITIAALTAAAATFTSYDCIASHN